MCDIHGLADGLFQAMLKCVIFMVLLMVSSRLCSSVTIATGGIHMVLHEL